MQTMRLNICNKCITSSKEKKSLGSIVQLYRLGQGCDVTNTKSFSTGAVNYFQEESFVLEYWLREDLHQVPAYKKLFK